MKAATPEDEDNAKKNCEIIIIVNQTFTFGKRN